MSVRRWEYNAWVIDPSDAAGRRPIGRFWYFGGYELIPRHMTGHRFAAFETRREARAALREVRATFPNAQVARAHFCVEVEVEL